MARCLHSFLLDYESVDIEEDFLGYAIRATGNLLGHSHIGEYNRKVPGRGYMPWDDVGQVLRDIDYSGCVVMVPFVRMDGTVGREIWVWRDLSEGADATRLDADISEALQYVRKNCGFQAIKFSFQY